MAKSTVRNSVSNPVIQQFVSEVDKYRLHYMNGAGQMLFRYDNSPHHPEIDSHPHHKHTPDKISPSNMPSIKDILNEISAIIVGIQI